ncbi:MAG: SIS domain-containing protein [Cyanobacteria bacterium SZAS LIN-3]|nr:SIS domain-containing protein [Cyanobacteria bacterium SZAS LIN-3]
MSDTGKRLEALYPFLHGKGKEPLAENASLLESIQRKAAQSIAEKERFFADNAQALIDAATAVAAVYRAKRTMFTMGNGGSSCDAMHFAVEFQHPVTAGRPSLPCISLTTDTAMISAVANDVGVDAIFSRQIEALGREGDGLIGFSTSGNSKNLLQAFRTAKKLGLTTIGMTGGDGGAMLSSGVVDHCLVVKTDSIHRVQEVHVASYHILWDLVHTLLADYRGLTGQEGNQ